MRWQTAMMAALVLAACETNEATDLLEVTAADLAGSYDLVTIGGSAPNQLDEWFCIDSSLDMDSDGSFEIQHHFTIRQAFGTTQPCSTAVGRYEGDLFWRGEFENTSTLVVMTILESEFSDASGSEVTADNTELVGEFNPQTNRLQVSFPDIWSFNPHGGTGGKISLGGGDARGLGSGTLIFDR